MNDFGALPQWRCHQVVRAARIKLVEPSEAEGWWVHLDLPGDRAVSIDGGVFARGIPKAGDYLVIYDDGYVSWSPAKAFEEGYTRIDAPAASIAST